MMNKTGRVHQASPENAWTVVLQLRYGCTVAGAMMMTHFIRHVSKQAKCVGYYGNNVCTQVQKPLQLSHSRLHNMNSENQDLSRICQLPFCTSSPVTLGPMGGGGCCMRPGMGASPGGGPPAAAAAAAAAAPAGTPSANAPLLPCDMAAMP